MVNGFIHQSKIFAQLIRRELHVLKPRLRSKFIDAGINMVIQILVFGSLLPIMGMPQNMIAPTFIGTIIQLSFSLGYGLALRLIFDLENTRFIDYYLTLPVSKLCVFGVYIIQFMIEVSLITLPLFLVGIIALGPTFTIQYNTLWLFAIVYFLSLLCMTSLFLAFSFSYPFRWFFDNLWPRRLNPLFLLSSVFFPWYKVYALSPIISCILLCNPFTYVAEGMRGALLGGSNYLPMYLCIPALVVAIMGSFLFFSRGIQTRLDPV